MFLYLYEHAVTCCYNYMFHIERVASNNKNYKTVVELNHLAIAFYSQAEHLFMRHHVGVMSKL